MNRCLIALFAILISPLSVPVHSEEFTRPPVWTIDSLVGKEPTYPGASCYTAALLAKGYENTVSFVGVKEMHFFVDHFCQHRDGPMQTGDLLTLTMHDTKENPPYLDHVAIYVGEGTVFEKELGAGTYEPQDPKEDPHFQIRPMSESRWIKNYVADGRDLNAYKCADASEVRASLATCEKRAKEIGIDTIRLSLEKAMFMTAPAFSLDPEALEATKTLTQAVRDLKETDPCFDYLLAMTDSVNYGFKSIRLKLLAKMPNAEEWTKAKEELGDLMWKRFTL